jgi:formylglycine-generating enzyme required for sulfatase activity
MKLISNRNFGLVSVAKLYAFFAYIISAYRDLCRNIIKSFSSQSGLGKLIIISPLIFSLFCSKSWDRHEMAIIKVAGKNFTMGQKGVPNAAPIEVAFSRDYAIDRTEVTCGFFKSIMGTSPAFFKGDTAKPIENISFVEAADFCNKRSIREGLEPCYNTISWACDRTKNGYRLPTEAEWEYACRAGSNSEYFWGKKVSPKYCWYKANSKESTHPVALTRPNKFGLFDMCGNVWEWCDDHFNANRSEKGITHWELGPKTLRGGSWSSSSDLLGSAVRDGGDPLGKSNGVGFRCVKNL